MRKLLLILGFFTSTSLGAQWRVAMLHGNAASYGEARADLDPDHSELHADRPATWTLSLARGAGPWLIAIDVHRTTADLAEAGTSSRVSTNDVLAAWGIGLEIAHRVAGSEGAATLRAGAGMSVDRWRFDLVDDSPRTRSAARGGLTADLPINQRWSAVIRGELTMGPSVFNAEELPEGFSIRTATRLGIVLGVATRW